MEATRGDEGLKDEDLVALQRCELIKCRSFKNVFHVANTALLIPRFSTIARYREIS